MEAFFIHEMLAALVPAEQNGTKVTFRPPPLPPDKKNRHSVDNKRPTEMFVAHALPTTARRMLLACATTFVSFVRRLLAVRVILAAALV